MLTFTIITTDPNEVVPPLHDRMSIIIEERDYNRWLLPGDPACLSISSAPSTPTK